MAAMALTASIGACRTPAPLDGSPVAVASGTPFSEREEEALHERERAGDLGMRFGAFRAEHRRGLAREAAAWIQAQSRSHYVPDGPIDHWATLEETLEHNGDDCDGLELLTSAFLRELGFGDDEVFRAIVVRESDGQHHMVTFWFEDRDDPWVIDPTGAMTTGMPRMSEVPGWVPLKVFSHNLEFSVRDRRLGPTASR